MSVDWVNGVASCRLARRVALRQARGRMPSLVEAVVRDGNVVWWGARGDVPAGDEPLRVRYRVGSITKTFVAVAVMRLRDEGVVDLDADAGVYVPGLGLPGATVARLLSHTGGLVAELPGQWWERSAGMDVAAWREVLAQADDVWAGQPGHGHHYSNVGFAVLGELVSRCRGRDWFDVVNDEILRPLGMNSTSLLPHEPYARGWAVHPFADVVMPENVVDTGAMAPAGQLWSTAADLASWAGFLAGDTGEVLAGDSWREMCQPQAVSDRNGWTSAWGLGVQLTRRGGRVLVGHGGSMPGFQAGVQVDVDSATGWVGLWNCTAAGDVGDVEDVFDIMEECHPRLPEVWRPAEAVPAATLELTGAWFWGPSQMVVRAEADGWLRATRVSGMGMTSRFRPDGDQEWVGVDDYLRGERLRVVRDADGVVSHLNVATFVWTRRPYEPQAVIPGEVRPWPVV